MGLGISIVTAICRTEADRERLAARSLARWFPRRSYGVVMRKGKYLSPQARAFVDLIKPDLFTREHDASGHSARSRRGCLRVLHPYAKPGPHPALRASLYPLAGAGLTIDAEGAGSRPRLVSQPRPPPPHATFLH